MKMKRTMRPRFMKRLILETPRLELREMDLADMAALSSMLQDERVMYAYNGAFDDEETRAWMEKRFGREVIGQCGITMQEYRAAQVPEIGYLLAYGHWHNGYATEAAAACREYGFDALHFDALYSIIRDTNVASQRVALPTACVGSTPSPSIIAERRCPTGCFA